MNDYKSVAGRSVLARTKIIRTSFGQTNGLSCREFAKVTGSDHSRVRSALAKIQRRAAAVSGSNPLGIVPESLRPGHYGATSVATWRITCVDAAIKLVLELSRGRDRSARQNAIA